MVVNRKQPIAPVAPPLSRSSSTQPIPTPTPTKKANKNATKSPLHQNGHGIDSRKTPPPPAPVKASKHKSKKRSSKSFLDRLFLLSLSLFAVYTFYTCRPNPLFPSSPSDALTHDPNALCRSLATYRTHVLDPYVLPPLRYTLTKTQAIAEPYVAQAHSHIKPYIAPAISSAKTLKPHVDRVTSTVQRIWKKTLVPFYKKTLKPYWRNAVLPRYNKFIRPRLVPLQRQAQLYFQSYVAKPLRIQLVKARIYIHAAYLKYAGPYISKAQPYIGRTINTARDASAKSLDFYKKHAHPRVVIVWKASRPVLCRAWKSWKGFSVKAINFTKLQLKTATKGLGSLRRTYVDPHVLRIWDKAVEGTNTSASSTPSVTKAADAYPVEPTAESMEEPTASVASADATATTVAIPVTAEVPVESEAAAEAEPLAPSPEEVVEATATGTHAGSRSAMPPPVDAYDEAEKVAEVVVEVPPPAAVVEAETAPVVTELPVEEEEHPSTADAPAAIPEEEYVVESTISEPVTPAPSASASSVPVADESVDLDDFLNDLGLADDATDTNTAAAQTVTASASPEQVQQEQQQQQDLQREPTPEEKQAELDRIAAKRLDIVTRHENWFVKLDEAVDEETGVLAQGLLALRNEKVKELDELRRKGAVDDVQRDGEKLVRGLDGYLNKAQGRKAAWKVVADDKEEKTEEKKNVAKKEKEKWGKLLAKVEEKFNDRVRKLQGEVHGWYMGVREKEMQEINNSIYRVKNVAERAQADIGLDYAWLEDVTYLDWQRYHDLARGAEAYQEKALAMQNGTDADAPDDPIVTDLNLLDGELQDVILGFQVALGAVRGEAGKVFSVREGSEVEDEDGFFVVRDGQVRKDDLRGVDLGTLDVKKKEGAGVVGVHSQQEEEKEDGEVRILPIDPVSPGKEEEKEDGAFDASEIVIGKDAVQIEQALKDVPLVVSSPSSEETSEPSAPASSVAAETHIEL
ncbi:hypothetical protein D9613_006694 [Agrocybe pediades]|uniref:Uncharacterized protein n=1 Tax=Agrocybe pediades TaxID=84607 RepID=A0A8H4VK90_9AGAR|nr:hypothetical protein D9613_006694 [Agrocybe pediades]